MNKTHTFTPDILCTLEDRCVPSTVAISGALHVLVSPPEVVHHLPGTFSQGDNPSFFVAPTGGKFTLSHMGLKR